MHRRCDVRDSLFHWIACLTSERAGGTGTGWERVSLSSGFRIFMSDE